jgi:hypothetical protein
VFSGETANFRIPQRYILRIIVISIIINCFVYSFLIAFSHHLQSLYELLSSLGGFSLLLAIFPISTRRKPPLMLLYVLLVIFSVALLGF